MSRYTYKMHPKTALGLTVCKLLCGRTVEKSTHIPGYYYFVLPKTKVHVAVPYNMIRES